MDAVKDEPADTASTILARAAELLRGTPFDDITYRALSEAAGVSERTVYRQYPTRSHLLESLARWIEEREFPLGAFVTVPEFQSAVRQRFHRYDAAPAAAFVCARAAVVSPTEVATPTFSTRAIAAMLRAQWPTLNDRDHSRLAATLSAFSSAPFWARMRASFDVDAAETADVFDRAIAGALHSVHAGSSAGSPTTVAG